MAVYKQTYRPYLGPKTKAIGRFLILTEHSLPRLFQSKVLLLLIALSMFYPILCATLIYLSHNSPAMAMFGLRSGLLPPIDGRFFYYYCTIQGSLAFLLTAIVAPSIIWPDLANGAMALYLSRPLSRFEYVAGKMAILVGLLSVITWIPGLVLYMIQAGCAGLDWVRDFPWLPAAIFLACATWIVALSLMALALSAWARWRTAAGAAILAIYFVGAGLGSAINSIWRTDLGSLLDLRAVVFSIWAVLFAHRRGIQVQPFHAWLVLAAISAVCVWILARRIRGFEVAR